MSEHDAKVSDLVEIAKRNGDFRKNWGPIIGAILYLRSIAAARGGSFRWKEMLAIITTSLVLLRSHLRMPYL